MFWFFILSKLVRASVPLISYWCFLKFFCSEVSLVRAEQWPGALGLPVSTLTSLGEVPSCADLCSSCLARPGCCNARFPSSGFLTEQCKALHMRAHLCKASSVIYPLGTDSQSCFWAPSGMWEVIKNHHFFLLLQKKKVGLLGFACCFLFLPHMNSDHKVLCPVELWMVIKTDFSFAEFCGFWNYPASGHSCPCYKHP